MTAQRNPDANSPERGSVTAEFALAIPGVVLVMLLVLSLAMQGAARITLEEGARAAARELARGESAATAEETLRETTGDRSDVTITAEGQYTAVVVTQPIRVLGLIELNAEQRAEAHARTEHLAGVGTSR
jgi:hypothetical protein